MLSLPMSKRAYLVSTLKPRLFCLTASFDRANEEVRSSLSTAHQSEGEGQLPRRPRDRNYSRLGLGGARDVEQTQLTTHFLIRVRTKMNEWGWWYKFFLKWMRLIVYSVVALAHSRTSFSRLFWNSSRNCVIPGSPSKSLKWLLTQSNTTRVTWETEGSAECVYIL